MRKIRHRLTMLVPFLALGCGQEQMESVGSQQSPLLSVYCSSGSCIPTTAAYTGLHTDESELGPVESEEMNGLAQSPTHWFWISKYKIDRVPASSGFTGTVDKNTGIPSAFGALGCNHFGDGDFYDGRLYIPMQGCAKPVILVYDNDLVLQAWATVRDGAGWVAINPTDGRLYTSHEYRMLEAYRMDNWQAANVVPSGNLAGTELGYVGRIPLSFIDSHSESWWGGAWIQGGDFSPNGIFYYVLDHGTEDNSSYSGVYAFDVTPFPPYVIPDGTDPLGTPAPQVYLAGTSTPGMLPVSYDPVQHIVWYPASRGDELEGLEVYRGVDGKTHVLVQKLSNEGDDDDVTVYGWSVNEPEGARVLYTPLIDIL